jgi:hypothetical protein
VVFQVATVLQTPRVQIVLSFVDESYINSDEIYSNVCNCSLSSADFPIRLLPDVVAAAGEKAGTLAHQWHGIQDGVPVTAALGDLQCYILSKVQDDTSAGKL